MNSNKPPAEEGGEISVLIKALREADLRLEELTGGEVDVVSDREGRSFMLKHAQDEFRYTEAAKQAALLNALPANIALVDAQGLIVSVNEGWRQFSAANGQMESGGAGVGANYLDVCDHTRGAAELEARQVATGLRAVLSGQAASYSLEYPCNSPTERRWYMVTVTPLAAEHLKGAAVMHFDVSTQKRGELAIRRFAAAMDAIADGIYLVDRADMTLIHVNDAGCRLANLSREQLMRHQPAVFLGQSRQERERAYDALIDNSGSPESLEVPLRIDGVEHWLEIRRHAHYLGERWVIVILVQDITARRQAQTDILRMNRVLALLSGVNTLIVRVRDRDELFQEACRIAVNAGGFRIAWIGLFDHTQMKLVPAAWEGADEELLTFIKDRFTSSADSPSGDSMTERALLEKRAVVSNDLEESPWFSARNVRLGIRSIGIWPLIVAGEAVGVIAFYASESGFFHQGELKLLDELAADIAFAMDHIEKLERIDYLAYYDVLTGLANRQLFLERVAQYMRRAVTAGHRLSLLCIDLERFKNINDSLGQAAGDTLLKQVADWLVVHVGNVELLARVEADHFAVVLPDVTHAGDVGRLLEKTIEQFLAHPFQLDGAPFRVAAKFGAAMFPDDGTDAETLFKHAEAAVKKAKAHGDRYLFYTEKMTESISGRLSLENQLRQAIDRQEFVLHYQPKMNLGSGELVGAEALIRWNDPRTGMVAPGRFIPVLEETGLIYEVGRWALNRAVADHLRWCSAGLAAVRVAVNVSPLQLRNRRFVDEIRQVVGSNAGAAAGLELEITESLIMEDVRLSIQSLEVIRAMGVTIAIDDFGTGFSSLSYLARLPVHTLKIDRSFVTDMTVSANGLALVSTIIALAHSLKLIVVAEGVETEDQSRMLGVLHCDEIQGYLVSKPLPVADFESAYLAPHVRGAGAAGPGAPAVG